jgi:O-antigen ligase
MLFSATLALSKSAANVLLTLTYIAIGVQVLRDRVFRLAIRDQALQPLVLPLLVYAGVAVVGLAYTERFSDGIGIVNKIAGLCLVYWMTATVIGIGEEGSRTRLSEDLLMLFLAGLLVLDAIGLLTYLGVIGQRKFTLPVYPLHVHHIWFANLNALGLYAALSLLLFGSGPVTAIRRRLLYSLIPLALFSILFSTSRTAWLGLAVTGIVMAYLAVPRKRLFFAALGIATTCCILAYLIVPLVHERIDGGLADIAQYAQGSRETSMGWRFLMWKASVAMFLSNPVFGIGTGDYVISMERFIGSGAYPESLLQFNQPHNMYLFALATNGLLGLGALLYLFYRIFAASLPGRSTDGPQWQSFLASAVAVHFLIAGLTDSLFNIFILRYSFAFFMGICVRNLLAPSAKTR